jgi:hypothetical protein
VLISRSHTWNTISSTINIFDADSDDVLWVSADDKRIGTYEERVLRILQQTKIAKYKEGYIVIEKQDKDWLTNELLNEAKISQENLLNLLEQKKKHGIIAEEFVLHLEKERLMNSGRPDLARSVRRISENNIAAGYDILSFDGHESNLLPGRFIEVKGTTSNQVLFYISKNELDMAKRMRNRYWIYCVLNVESKKLKQLKMIKNPYRAILHSRELKAECLLWRVCSSGDKDNL